MAKRIKASNIFVYILLGLLIAGLIGFGINPPGGRRNLSIGAVGDEEILANTYALALNNEIQSASNRFGAPLTFDQALALGLDRSVLGQLLATAALDGEGRTLGVSVGDDRVRDQLLATQAFQGLNGSFDQTAYEFTLRQAGLTAPEYDNIVRKEDARQLLEQAIIAGLRPDATYAKTLLSYIGEARSFRWAVVKGNTGPQGAPEPSEDQINTYYQENPGDFTAPLTRKISYVWITPDQLSASLEIEEDALQKLYDSQPQRFNVPARRIVDRVVFPDQASAEEAMAELNSGSKTFTQVVESRGLTVGDVALGDVQKEDLASGAREGVFALTDPGIAGVLNSEFGPAIYRINAILEARLTTFEAAREGLREELAAETAVGQIDDRIVEIDDLLADGVSLEDIADETDLSFGTIDLTADSADGIASYDEFQTEANTVTQSDFPEVRQLAGGGIFALRLDAEVPPTLIPLDQVRPLVIDGWKTAANHAALVKKAEGLRLLLASGGDFKNLELESREELNMRRDAFVENAPVDTVRDVFELALNDVAIVAGDSSVILVRLTNVIPFAVDRADNAEVLANLQNQFGDQLAGDVFQAFATNLQDAAGVTVNQAVINAVHAQLTGTGGVPVNNAPAHNRMP